MSESASSPAARPTGQRILTVDDDPDCLMLLGHILRLGGYEVSTLRHPEGLPRALETEKPALVITDIMMPGVTGAMVYQQIRSLAGPNMPVIVSSGTSLRLRVDDPLLAFCPKPVDMGKVLPLVTEMLDAAAARVGGPDADTDLD